MSFWCLQILPKNEWKQVDLKFIVVKSNFSVHFLEELRIPKSPYEMLDFLNKYWFFLICGGARCYLVYMPMLLSHNNWSKIMVLWTPTTRIIFPWESLKCHKVSFWKFLSGFLGILYLEFKKCLHCEISQMHTMRILPSLSFRQQWVEDLFKGR